MPNTKEHLSIIEHNYDVVKHLAKPDTQKFIDWSVTIIYYMAVHFVHAYLSKYSDHHPDSHIILQGAIRNTQQLKPIYDNYRQLEDDARRARYKGEKLSIYDIRRDTLKWFKDIQNHISKSLKADGCKIYDFYKLFPL